MTEAIEAPTSRSKVVRGLFDTYLATMTDTIAATTSIAREIPFVATRPISDVVQRSNEAMVSSVSAHSAKVVEQFGPALTVEALQAQVRRLDGEIETMRAVSRAGDAQREQVIGALHAKIADATDASRTRLDGFIVELRRTADADKKEFEVATAELERNLDNAKNATKQAERIADASKTQKEYSDATTAEVNAQLVALTDRFKDESAKNVSNTATISRVSMELSESKDSLEKRDQSLTDIHGAIMTQVSLWETVKSGLSDTANAIVHDVELSDDQLNKHTARYSALTAQCDVELTRLRLELADAKLLASTHEAAETQQTSALSELSESYTTSNEMLRREIDRLRGTDAAQVARNSAERMLSVAMQNLRLSCNSTKKTVEVANNALLQRSNGIVSVVKLFYDSEVERKYEGSTEYRSKSKAPVTATLRSGTVGAEVTIKAVLPAEYSTVYNVEPPLTFVFHRSLVGDDDIKAELMATIREFNEHNVTGYGISVISSLGEYDDDKRRILCIPTHPGTMPTLIKQSWLTHVETYASVLAKLKKHNTPAVGSETIGYNVHHFIDHTADAPAVFTYIDEYLPWRRASADAGIMIVATGASGTGKTTTLIGNKQGSSHVDGVITSIVREMISENKSAVFMCAIDVYLQEARAYSTASKKFEKITFPASEDLVLDVNAVMTIANVEEFLTTIAKLHEQRVVRATLMNADSSRSHYFLLLGFTAADARSPKHRGTIVVADLAGDENANSAITPLTMEELGSSATDANTATYMSQLRKMLSNSVIRVEGAAVSADLNTMQVYYANASNYAAEQQEMRYREIMEHDDLSLQELKDRTEKGNDAAVKRFTPKSGTTTDMYKLLEECRKPTTLFFAMVKLSGKAAFGIEKTLQFVHKCSLGNESAYLKSLATALRLYKKQRGAVCDVAPHETSARSTAAVEQLTTIANAETSVQNELNAVFAQLVRQLRNMSATSADVDEKALRSAISARDSEIASAEVKSAPTSVTETPLSSSAPATRTDTHPEPSPETPAVAVEPAPTPVAGAAELAGTAPTPIAVPTPAAPPPAQAASTDIPVAEPVVPVVSKGATVPTTENAVTALLLAKTEYAHAKTAFETSKSSPKEKLRLEKLMVRALIAACGNLMKSQMSDEYRAELLKRQQDADAKYATLIQ